MQIAIFFLWVEFCITRLCVSNVTQYICNGCRYFVFGICECVWLFVFFRFVGLSPSTGLCFYGWVLRRHVVHPVWPTQWQYYSSNANLNVSSKGDFKPQDLTDLTKPWRSWMYLEKMFSVNLYRLAVCPDSDIPLIGPFFPFFFLFLSIFNSLFILLLYILLLSPFLYFFRHFYAYVCTELSDHYTTALTICLSKNYHSLLIYKFHF